MAFKLHITPCELDNMEFYRIELLLKEYEDHINKENEQYETQKAEQENAQQTQAYSLPKYELPKMSMPTSNFSMPKI